MLKPFLEIGKIVSTHGIKGEVRVQPWCDSGAFMKKFSVLYLDKKGETAVKIVSCRPHGNVVIMKLEGVDTPEQAARLRSKVLFMDRNDAKLEKGQVFIQDLIGCTVFDADNENKVYGKITDVSQTGANDVWHITDESGREFLIPVIPSVVLEVDAEHEKVIIRPLKGIFDGEVNGDED